MKRANGFTIVELLIVIVVVAILATLSYVGYTNISNRAYDSSIQNDLAQIGKKLELYRVDRADGNYPTNTTLLSGLGIKISKEAYGNHFANASGEFNLVYCPGDAGSGAIALVASSKSGNRFVYANGTVSTFNGRWTGSVLTCRDAGAPVVSGYGAVWFLFQDTWATWL